MLLRKEDDMAWIPKFKYPPQRGVTFRSELVVDEVAAMAVVRFILYGEPIPPEIKQRPFETTTAPPSRPRKPRRK